MALELKDWHNLLEAEDTPLSAEAMEELESRIGDYIDEVAAGGVELGYAQITASHTRTGVGSEDVTGLTTTVTVGARPINIIFSCGGVSNSGAGLSVVQIQEGATVLAKLLGGVGTSSTHGGTRIVRLAPTAGSHTYKIVLGQTVTGNSVMAAASDNPAFIQVIEV